MPLLMERIHTAQQFLNDKTENYQPAYGLVLGTGLSGLSEEIDQKYSIPYEDIPHFPVSTAPGHAGKLIFGELEGVPIVAMAGRFHYYEGYSMQELTFPIRVLHSLGIKRLFLSNAAGGLNSESRAGDIFLINDHINLMGDNPLRGPNDERLGPRFPDMLKAYDNALIREALDLALRLHIPCRAGVYVALAGPSLETAAEYRYLHDIGGDLVGMSTVPEVLVAKHEGLPVFALSVVSNVCYPIEQLTETSVEDVLSVVKEASPKVQSLIKALIKQLHEKQGEAS